MPETRPAEPAMILVVDDDSYVSQLLADVLAVEGHAVDTARNGRVALEKLSRRMYDVILTDLRMPELDGPGFYRELGQRFPALTARVVFISGDAPTPALREFVERVKVPFLQKPFELGSLRRVLREVRAGG